MAIVRNTPQDTATVSVTPDQVRRYRLLRSGLLEPFSSPESASAELHGIQAQILPAGALALWNRTSGLTYARFEELLYERRTLVKLWGQRGTLHLYASTDWPLVCSMMTNVKSWWGMAADKEDRYEEYAQLVAQAEQLLRQRGVLGRSDLRTSGLPIDTDHLSSWGGLFSDLVRLGYACHAGRLENEGLFAHRTYWLPDLAWEPPDPDTMNLAVARRYLHTYGPATLQDFTYWLGLKAPPARRSWRTVEDELVPVEVKGVRQYILHEDLAELTAPAEPARWPVRLLYRFDPLLLAHKEKSWVVPAAAYKQVWRSAGHIEGIVLARGQGVATWRYVRKGRGLVTTVTPFKRLAKVLTRKIERQAQQVASFFDLPLQSIHFEGS